MKIFRKCFWMMLLSLILLIGLSACNAVSKDNQEKAKQILLEKYPSLEMEIQEIIKAEHPHMVGKWKYVYQKTQYSNIVAVNYGIFGLDWLKALNPFSEKNTRAVYFTFQVNLDTKEVFIR